MTIRTYAASLLFLFFSLPLVAEIPPGGGFYILPTFGVSSGGASEIVYDMQRPDNTNDYLSLLEWDIKPAYLFGANIGWIAEKGWRIDTSLKTTLPGATAGTMSDQDWSNANDPEPTQWSISDIYYDGAYIIDAGFDVPLFPAKRVFFRMGGWYHLEWWAWTDVIKDSSYGLPVGTNAIDYNVGYHSILLSLSVDLDFPSVYGRLITRCGPMFGSSKDHHKLRTDLGPEGGYFYDYAAGLWFDVAGEIFVPLGQVFYLFFRGDYNLVPETRGNSIMVRSDDGSQTEYPDSAGMAFSRYSFTLGITFRGR